MKVAQEIDVDGVTIVINTDNKLEAKIPTTTGVTDFKFDASTGATPGGTIRIDNVKNNIANREMYTIDGHNVSWVGMLGRD